MKGIDIFLLLIVMIFNTARTIFMPTRPPTGVTESTTGSVRFDLEVKKPQDAQVLTIGSHGNAWNSYTGGELQKESVSSVEAEYGSWKSPVNASMAVAITHSVLEPPRVDPVTGFVFWCEDRGTDGPRGVIFHYNPQNGEVIRWTPDEYDVRTRVHEYGGGAFTVYNNTVYFSHERTGALYRQNGPQNVPTKLTKTTNRRYADGVYSPKWNSLFIVMEDHSGINEGSSVSSDNAIVMIDVNTGKEDVLIMHADFFASPRLTQDGTKLVWVQWNHPQMPWDENRMFVANLEEEKGSLAINKFFQHGSMMMPTFSQNKELFYVHDSSGWWNLYWVNRRGFEINLTPISQEVGWPMWRLGRQAYDVNPRLGSNEVVVICGHDLIVVDLNTQIRRVLNTGYNTYNIGVAYDKTGDKVYVVAGNGIRTPHLVEIDVKTGLSNDISGSAPNIDQSYISTPTLLQFPTTQTDFAYGYLYMPKNPDYHAPPGTLPPLLVRVHHKPTEAATPVFNPTYQYFTSRGWAVLDVDYRGSTGYGKLYRNKLAEMWGVYDAEDVLAGASHLVEGGQVNGSRLAIVGDSIAAYTALSALTIPGSIFTAGASYYGVSDPELLARKGNKFTGSYMDGLMGSLDKHRDRYVTRSPLRNHARLQVPVIFLHGVKDQVVPPTQANGMYKKLKYKGIPTAFMLFQDEGHGFRNSSVRKSALEAEYVFLSTVFNIIPSDVTSNVTINNMDAIGKSRGFQ